MSTFDGGNIKSTGVIDLGPGDDDYVFKAGSPDPGPVDGGAGDNTLHLSNPSQSMIPQAFQDFVHFDHLVIESGNWFASAPESFLGGIEVNPGAQLILNDQISQGSINNNGSLVFANSGPMAFTNISGSGSFDFGSSSVVTLYGQNTTAGSAFFWFGTLEIASTGALGTTAIFVGEGDAATIKVDAGVSFTNQIYNFGYRSSIDLVGFDATSATTSYDIARGLLIIEDGAGNEATLHLAKWDQADTFVASPSSDGVLITGTDCFVSGTLIATPVGERPVETLAIGDEVLTNLGGVRTIKWMGRLTLLCGDLQGANGQALMPVRIQAGALGAKLPVRDLLLSPDHAVLVGDLLVQSGGLVNGVTVVRETRTAPFTYWHVELDNHELILAEGLAAETFIANAGRKRFSNWAEYQTLYGEETVTAVEMETPRVQSARQLPERVRRLMTERVDAAVEQVAQARAIAA